MKTDPDTALLIAFIQGAKWWEYAKTGATMWQSDQKKASDEAERRLRDGSLGNDRLVMIACQQRR